jgi:hypothetical protein
MRIVDLSVTVEECDAAPFAKEEADQIPSRARVIALPAKWRTESAPARVIALLED